jgi:hypothetical protein
LFLRLVMRRYMLTYLTCTYLFVKRYIKIRVPTHLEVGQGTKCLKLLDLG